MKYTPIETRTCTRSSQLSPVMARSTTYEQLVPKHQRKMIHGHPAKHLALQKPTFAMRKHVLQRHKFKTYLKCCINGCPLAYVTFHKVRELNTRHRLYHLNMVYRCKKCHKTVTTPSTWKFHNYCQMPKLHKCDVCRTKFMYSSRLKQHKCSHITQKHYKCFHGGCNKTYKHLQDLEHHTSTHLNIMSYLANNVMFQTHTHNKASVYFHMLYYSH